MAIIGIDLGTSNSLVSYWRDGEAIMVSNVFNEFLTPSIISIDETGEILVGKSAKERLISHPDRTAAVFKRYMGTKKKFQLAERSFSSVELSMLLLRQLKQDVEVYLEEKIEGAVITVPAYFNNLQREATMQAAELSGIPVLGLVSEPTAAALAYGIHRNEADLTFIIVDLGGGTFDVSILEMFEGVMQVRAISGDNLLGGENFSEQIISYILEEKNITKEMLTKTEQSLLYKKVESLKKQIGIDKVMNIEFSVDNNRYKCDISSGKIKEICQKLLLRMRLPILRALKDANTSIEELDHVILIGGATKLDIVQDYLRHLLLKFPYTNIDPEQAVALGASVQAALITRNQDVSEFIMTDVCGFSLGVEVTEEYDGYLSNGMFQPIIDRNSTIPISIEETFRTMYPNQEKLEINVYQGENRRVEDNLKIGTLTFSLPKSDEQQLVNIRFTYDTNGILEVIAILPETKEEHTCYIQQGKRFSKEEIQASFSKLTELKTHPREREENRYLLARGERIYAETIGAERDSVKQSILAFETALAKQNEIEIRNAAKKLKALLASFEEEL